MSVEARQQRCMHSCVTYGDSLYYFGGENSESLWTNDFFSLTLPQGNPVWKKENGNTLKRDGHSATIVENEMYVLGGSTSAKSDKIQLSSYNFETKEWSDVEFSGDSPCPRKLHTACFSEKLGELLVFGGETDNKQPTFLNDLYAYNIKEKSWRKVESQNPSGRSGHSAVIQSNKKNKNLTHKKDEKMYIFGGSNVSADKASYFKDLLVLDVESMTWSKLATSGDAPMARSNHKSVLVSGKLYIYGGWCPNNTNLDNSVYELNLETSAWSKVKNSNSSVRFLHTFDFLDNYFVIFGGRNAEFSLLNDLSIFKLSETKDEDVTSVDDKPENGWISVEQVEKIQKVEVVNVFEVKEQKQVLEDVVIKKKGGKKKRPPTKIQNVASTLDTMEKADISLPSEDRLESLEQESKKVVVEEEEEVKKPKALPGMGMGGGMFGGFNPAQVQLKKTGNKTPDASPVQESMKKPSTQGFNPFAGGPVQLKSTKSESPSEPVEEAKSESPVQKTNIKKQGFNPFGDFKPKPKE